MLDGDAFLRYSRQLLMPDVGEGGQEKLLAARVLVVGVGGLGCPVSLYLTAAGVGELVLCDPDVVDKTNLQRQVLYRENDCGLPKVDCAARALEKLNPGVKISTHAQKADPALLAQWLEQGCEAVVDCTDNIAARHGLNRACMAAKVPLISAAALGWEGQLMSFDFRHWQSPCLACAMAEGGGEPLMNCANSGVLGPVLGAMGSLQAVAVLRLLLGLPLAHGRLQRYDGKLDQWFSLTIGARQDCPVCAVGGGPSPRGEGG